MTEEIQTKEESIQKPQVEAPASLKEVLAPHKEATAPHKEMPQPMNFFMKLTCIQNEINVPKNQYNHYGKYHYRSVEDIQAALKPLLKKYRVAVKVTDDVIRVKDRFYVQATACLRDCESGAWAENTAYAREEDERKGMAAAQVTGSCSSYARKYALGGLFLLDDVQDEDAREIQEEERQRAQQIVSKTVTQDQIAQLKRLFEETQLGNVMSLDTRITNMLNWVKAPSIPQLTQQQWQACMHHLQMKKEKMHNNEQQSLNYNQ